MIHGETNIAHLFTLCTLRNIVIMRISLTYSIPSWMVATNLIMCIEKSNVNTRFIHNSDHNYNNNYTRNTLTVFRGLLYATEWYCFGTLCPPMTFHIGKLV